MFLICKKIVFNLFLMSKSRIDYTKTIQFRESIGIFSLFFIIKRQRFRTWIQVD